MTEDDRGAGPGHDRRPEVSAMAPAPRAASSQGAVIPVPPTAVPPAHAGSDSTIASDVPGVSSDLSLEQAATTGLLGRAFESRYEVRSLLGHGGMGEVHVARDQLIGREVALKVIREAEGEPQPARAARFMREARIQGQLEHPSIVPVYDLGVSPQGQAYFTMKRVRGVTLSELIAALRRHDAEMIQRFSRRRLLTAFSNVCLAVDFAHRRGVLHRDLKPGNVILGDFGEVYVLDWGLARIFERSTNSDSVDAPLRAEARTIEGTLMGTPGYMAPEQVRGELDALGAPTDVYALGVILFELLTLEPLHGRGASSAIIVSTLTGAADARPSVRAPALDLPPELDTICARATALAPSERYESARALSEAVEHFLDGDRDLEMRRKMAASHASAAATAAQQALAEGPGAIEQRTTAMQAVGRALALDPHNTDALRTMLRLMTEPPRAIPPEAHEHLERSVREQTRLAARVGGVGYFFFFLFVPLLLWMGVSDPIAASVSLVLAASAIALSLVSTRIESPRPKLQIIVLILSTLAIISTSRMFGPLVLLPSVAAVNTIGFSITPIRSRRALFIVCGCLTIVIPVILEWTGVWPRSYVFEGGAMHIVPQMLRLPEAPAFLFLLFSSLAVVIGGAYFVGRVRDALTDAEQRLQLQAWQLEQLVPRAARGALTDTEAKP
jgi:serine/threonine-protein kinase